MWSDFRDTTLAAPRFLARRSQTLFGYRVMVKEARVKFTQQSAKLEMTDFVDVVEWKPSLKIELLVKMGLSLLKFLPDWYRPFCALYKNKLCESQFSL
jgi:hypothetical protein